MKKIAYNNNQNELDIVDSNDYLIIQNDNERIGNKCVYSWGEKIDNINNFKKDNIIVRSLYYLGNTPSVNLRNFKSYNHYIIHNSSTRKFRKNLKIKKSTVYFYRKKHWIVKVFSNKVIINITQGWFNEKDNVL